MNTIIVQGLGFVGVALFILSYQIKSNRALFFCQMLGCAVFCVQFFLLGAYTGAISLIVNIVRNILLLKAGEWKWARSKAVLCAILLFLTVMTAFTWDGWKSLLPWFSFSVTTIGYWTQNAQKIRISQMLGAPLIHSWGGAVSEGITLLSILVSIYRFGWKNLAQQNS